MNFGNTSCINDKARTDVSKTVFKVLFSLLWIHYTAYLFLYRIFVRIPIVTMVADAIFPLCAIFLIALSAPFILKKMRILEIVIYFAFVLAFGISVLFSPERVSLAIENDWARVLLYTIPFIFVGVCFDVEENEKLLFFMSLAGLVAMILFQLYALLLAGTVIADNMAEAYNVLPAAAYLVYYAVNHSSFFTWSVAVASFALLFSYGTRGTILCIIVYLSILLIYKISKMRSSATKIFAILLVIAILFLCFFTNFITDIMLGASELFSDIGVSTRIFDLFLEESITDDSGRGRISGKVLQGVSENALLGYGVMGDRNFVSNYAHNIVYELWCSFGVVLGTLIFVLILLVPVYAIIKTKSKKEKLFIWMLLSITIVKLFMSSSYLYETNLFLMIGYSLAVIRRSKNAVA